MGKKKIVVKNEMQTDRKGMGVICFFVCFVSPKRSGENAIPNVNNSRDQLLN